MNSNYETMVPRFSKSGIIGKTVQEIGSRYKLNIFMPGGDGIFYPGSIFKVSGDHLIIRKMRCELDLY